MGKRWYVPLGILIVGAAAVWPFRGALTAEAIAARSPGQLGLAAVFLWGLYAVKSLSVAFPLSALVAAGGMLFPYPAAVAVNLAGVAVAQVLPYWLGRRQQGGLEALGHRYPRLAELQAAEMARPGRLVFLLRLAGATPGDLVSMCLGAAGVPLGAYLAGGLLGSLPRVACTTALGAALWHVGGRDFWLSLGAGAALTAAALVLGKIWGQRTAAM